MVLIQSEMNEDKARALLTPWIDRLGLGFHPDTCGADYVVVGKAGIRGARFFTDEEAARYDADIEASCGLGDIYAVSLKIWEEKGLL